MGRAIRNIERASGDLAGAGQRPDLLIVRRAPVPPSPRRPRGRGLILIGALAVVLGLAAVTIAFFIDEPLRRRMERDLNAALVGYTVRIAALSFHPLGFSIDLIDSTIRQEANPEPPVAHVPRLHASVHWRALLHGRLVADFLFERPVLRVDRRQAVHEARDAVPMKDRGWQEAAETIYPLRINLLRVVNGDVTYVDRGPFEPLRLSHLNFRAENIRNVRSRDRVYPSDVHVDALVFGSGSVRADGHADFLAEPYAGLDTFFHVDRVPLRPFTALIERYATIRGGVVSAAGEVEYSPRVARVDLKDATVDGIQVDYLRTADNAVEEARGTEAVVRTAQAVSNAPTVQVRADHIRIRHGLLGFVNRTATPMYRLFMSDTDFMLRHFTNQRSEGSSFAELRGRFMGSGETLLRTRFQPETRSPNVDLDLRIERTELGALNDLLRANGNFDVVAGDLSLYSVLRVRGTAVDGYVKPVFSGVQVYDAGQDGDKPFFHRVYERLVGAVMWLLESHGRREVATRADVSGPLTAPRTSRWQIVGGLLKNAFIQPIVPGVDAAAVGEPRPTSGERAPAHVATARRVPLAGSRASGHAQTRANDGSDRSALSR